MRDDIIPTFVEFPILRSRRQRRRRVPHFDISECFESMHQNMSTIQNLMNCRSKYDEQQVIQNRNIVPFDFNKVKLEVGQWVDVKDTIDQWLEAQVLQVRNNQAFVHYNGWGSRWDEWIDFNSPRIAPFKTYTTQSPTTLFLSPYPSVPCDANLEPQPRSIDSFYYLEKSVSNMTDLCKTIEYMSKLRKKNLSRFNEVKETFVKEEKEKSFIRKDDFVENKDKENQFKANTNTVNFTNTLSHYDYELLFNASQLIPMLDRCGRMLSDMSLHLSHLVLNPSLYPQLLLGYNQNIEVSDTLSCTSGYSMYTNESSSITGLPGHQIEHNLLQNFRGNIQNSNQLITNYNMSHMNNPNASVNYTNTPNTQQNQTISHNQYNINGSSPELPFIQRIQNSRSQSQSNQQIYSDAFPKINLQVPSLLSPGETFLQNGINPYPEPNIDIYVHTLVAPNQPSTNNSNPNILNNTSPNANTNITRNPIERGPINISNQNITNNIGNLNTATPQNYSLNSLINQNLSSNRSQSNNNLTTIPTVLANNINNQEADIQIRNNNNITSNQNTSTIITNTTNSQSNQSEIINNLLGNLMSIIGSSGNRRGSTTSESSNTSFNYHNTSSNMNTALNTNSIINNNTTNTINNNSNNMSTAHPYSSTRIINSTNSLNNQSSRIFTNQNNSANNSSYKETSSQTDMTLNLLSLNKDNK